MSDVRGQTSDVGQGQRKTLMGNVEQVADEQHGVHQTVENLPIAASLQKVQTLTYLKYAATLNFFCFLPLEFLNSLPGKDFFSRLV
jgi:5,10-methylenetetrahydrofolate reductase